ncbi:40S ribosomal protein S27 [Entomophthora muscae]|uniref:40S ribosomal protein S27 n=1 Tax=Entomophthora muscae TaxID=34485 RepID=A0ACC2S134_9FUNG|nr:40S ribosomal protein S27 [Entomophthora muscae]
MFDSESGDQFYMKGVAYQPRESGLHDPLNSTDCKRDAKLLKELGANTIRVYETYPWLDHTICMQEFEEKGIYVVFDLAIPEISINREQPHYDTDIFVHFKQKVDAFSGFSNTLAFLAGNEVTNDAKTTPASAHIKAALRDIKKYVSTKSRVIPVGYADNDDPDIRKNIQDYFNCGDDSDRADFYGINIYSWCGKSSFKESAFDQRTNELKDYDRPVILSEYGCNKGKRLFDEIKSLYGKDMQDVFSGGLVYEYSQETNNYGLVEIKGSKATPLEDYETVKTQFAGVDPKGVSMSSYTSRNKKRQCPKVEEGKWLASSKLPLTPSEAACDCILQTLPCRVNEQGEHKDNGQAVGALVGQACGDGNCELIESDTALGNYGPFSFCNTTVRNSIVFSQAVEKGAKCSFDGFASPVKPESSTKSTECADLPANMKSAPLASKPKGFTNAPKRSKYADPDDSDEVDGKNSTTSKSKKSSQATPLIPSFVTLLSVAISFLF